MNIIPHLNPVTKGFAIYLVGKGMIMIETWGNKAVY